MVYETYLYVLSTLRLQHFFTSSKMNQQYFATPDFSWKSKKKRVNTCSHHMQKGCVKWELNIPFLFHKIRILFEAQKMLDHLEVITRAP